MSWFYSGGLDGLAKNIASKEDKMDCNESKEMNSRQPDYFEFACAAAAYFEN